MTAEAGRKRRERRERRENDVGDGNSGDNGGDGGDNGGDDGGGGGDDDVEGGDALPRSWNLSLQPGREETVAVGSADYYTRQGLSSRGVDYLKSAGGFKVGSGLGAGTPGLDISQQKSSFGASGDGIDQAGRGRLPSVVAKWTDTDEFSDEYRESVNR